MKERIIMKLAAILMICGMTAGLMSCSNDDNPVNVKSEDILGTWYAEFDQAGVYGEGESAKAYAKAEFYGSFYEGNDGLFVCLFIDADGNAIDLGDTFLGAGCKYTVMPNGKVNIRLTGSSAAVTLNPQWTMTYRDGQLIGKVRDEGEIKMSRITEEQRAQYQEWMRQLGLGNDSDHASPQDNVVDLSTVEEGYYEAHDGDILTGLLEHYDWPDYTVTCNIEIPNNATITLRDATIGGEYFVRHAEESYIPGIICRGNATILLEGVNHVFGNYYRQPCISVKQNCKLTIKASNNVPKGELPVLEVYNGGEDGTAIGGSRSDAPEYHKCGDITIARCKLKAEGIGGGPNIGCREGGSCGSIQFLDGCYVEAWGGWGNVAIGCGHNASCAEVLVAKGATVIARAGNDAPAIGASHSSSTCSRIVAEGTVKAYRKQSTTEKLPVSAWLDADVVNLSTHYTRDIRNVMLEDGAAYTSGGLTPGFRRNKNEFFVDPGL